ncbi:hypothetical protein NDA16_000803 [Ustilago loliicola]|nr:hypothetical protein NDA16_000803 [Ustilago loliicola]
MDAFDDILGFKMSQIYKLPDNKRDPDIAKLYKNRGLPHTLSLDHVMRDDYYQVLLLIEDIMGDDEIVTLSRNMLSYTIDAIKHANYEDEKGLDALMRVRLFQDLIVTLFTSLATRILQLQSESASSNSQHTLPSSDKAHLALQQLMTGFDGKYGVIEWDVVEQGTRIRSKPLPRNDGKDSTQTDQDQANSDVESSTNAPTVFDSRTTQLKTDLLFTLDLKKRGDDNVTPVHAVEIKCFHFGNSDKLRGFFEPEPELELSSSSNSNMPEESFIKQVTRKWLNIDLRQLVKSRQKFDRQALGGVSQSITYIPAHRVPLVLLTTGLTNIFRYDHSKAVQQPGAPIDMLYFMASAPTQPLEPGLEPNADTPVWKPLSLCRCILYSLVRGIADAFTTTELYRNEWSERLAETLPTVQQLGLYGTAGSKGKRPARKQDVHGSGRGQGGEDGSDSARDDLDKSSGRKGFDTDDQGGRSRGQGKGDRSESGGGSRQQPASKGGDRGSTSQAPHRDSSAAPRSSHKLASSTEAGANFDEVDDFPIDGAVVAAVDSPGEELDEEADRNSCFHRFF